MSRGRRHRRDQGRAPQIMRGRRMLGPGRSTGRDGGRLVIAGDDVDVDAAAAAHQLAQQRSVQSVAQRGSRRLADDDAGDVALAGEVRSSASATASSTRVRTSAPSDSASRREAASCCARPRSASASAGVSTLTAIHSARTPAAMRRAARTRRADAGAGPTITSMRSPAGHRVASMPCSCGTRRRRCRRAPRCA
jgi:hypothetical protein